MPSKNLALEISLVVCAIMAAFLIQFVVPQKPPAMPDFESSKSSQSAPAENPVVAPVSEIDVHDSPLPNAFDPNLSALGTEPDWSVLDAYQNTVTRAQFVRLLDDVYTTGDYWEQWFKIDPEAVEIRTSAADPSEHYTLKFAAEELEESPQRYWRTKQEMGERSENAPLAGIQIAIDPGHIGGRYAQIEERRFILAEGTPPVQEGNMTLTVAELLTEQLEALGANVFLVREKNVPVNNFRAKDYLVYAKNKLAAEQGVMTKESVQREAEQLFYRNGEIRARAFIVNQELKPDLVLCLHFNAAAELNPENPSLVEDEHFHMILNGAYTESELAHDDERFQCVLKIVQGNHVEEAKLAKAAAASFVQQTKLPAYRYAPQSGRAVNVDGNPYLWARNLLANRLYECPVLYFEPYLMNGRDSYQRMQAGDYPALAYVNGKLRPSIYREYVDAVTKGLVAYYTQKEDEKAEESGDLTDTVLELLLEQWSRPQEVETQPEMIK